MFLPTFLLFTVATLTIAYGPRHYGSYGSYSSEEDKSHCKKLRHYDVDSTNLIQRAKFTELVKNGKHYTMISCPNDAHQYALVAEHSGSVFSFFNSTYSNTAVLAAGFKIGVLARCDGKRTSVKTTDGKKIKIRKVACIQNGDTTTSNPPAVSQCTKCDIRALKPLTPPGTEFLANELAAEGECRKTSVGCSLAIGSICGKITLGISDAKNQINYLSTRPGEKTVYATLNCQDDGKYEFVYDDFTATGIEAFSCTPDNCQIE